MAPVYSVEGFLTPLQNIQVSLLRGNYVLHIA